MPEPMILPPTFKIPVQETLPLSTVNTSVTVSGVFTDAIFLKQNLASPSSWKSNANLKLFVGPICLILHQSLPVLPYFKLIKVFVIFSALILPILKKASEPFIAIPPPQSKLPCKVVIPDTFNDPNIVLSPDVKDTAFFWC